MSLGLFLSSISSQAKNKVKEKIYQMYPGMLAMASKNERDLNWLKLTSKSQDDVRKST